MQRATCSLRGPADMATEAGAGAKAGSERAEGGAGMVGQRGRVCGHECGVKLGLCYLAVQS